MQPIYTKTVQLGLTNELSRLVAAASSRQSTTQADYIRGAIAKQLASDGFAIGPIGRTAAERERENAILNCPEAAGRRALAQHLAWCTTESVASCRKALAAGPRDDVQADADSIVGTWRRVTGK